MFEFQEEDPDVLYVHVGEGVVIRKSEDETIKEYLREVWPEVLVTAKVSKQQSGRTSKDETQHKKNLCLLHKKAYDTLIFALWPANTHLRYSKLKGFDNQVKAEFHTKRQSVAEGVLITMLI